MAKNPKVHQYLTLKSSFHFQLDWNFIQSKPVNVWLMHDTILVNLYSECKTVKYSHVPLIKLIQQRSSQIIRLQAKNSTNTISMKIQTSAFSKQSKFKRNYYFFVMMGLFTLGKNKNGESLGYSLDFQQILIIIVTLQAFLINKMCFQQNHKNSLEKNQSIVMSYIELIETQC